MKNSLALIVCTVVGVGLLVMQIFSLASTRSTATQAPEVPVRMDQVREWQGPSFGMRIRSVEAGSPGEQLGLRVGQVVSLMDGQSIRSDQTWTRIRGGRACTLAVYDPDERKSFTVTTGTGLLGIEFNNFWYPESVYLRETGQPEHVARLVAEASSALRDKRYARLRESLDQIPPSESEVYPIKQLKLIGQLHADPSSLKPGEAIAVLDQIPKPEAQMLHSVLVRCLILNGRYRELREFIAVNDDLIPYECVDVVNELGRYEALEDEVRKRSPADIDALPWKDAPYCELFAQECPDDWASAINERRPFSYSAPTDSYQQFGIKPKGVAEWAKVSFTVSATDAEVGEFGKRLRLSYVVQKDEAQSHRPRVAVMVHADGLVDLNVGGAYYSGVYPAIRDGGKTAIDLDLITVDHVWYVRINGREIGRGPMFFPPQHKKFYMPFVHMCGASGEVTHLSRRYIK